MRNILKPFSRLSVRSRYKKQEVEYVRVEKMGLFRPQIAGDFFVEKDA